MSSNTRIGGRSSPVSTPKPTEVQQQNRVRSEPPPPQQAPTAPRTPAIQDTYSPASTARPLVAELTPAPVTAELDPLGSEPPPQQEPWEFALQDAFTPAPTEASLVGEPAPVTLAQEQLLEEPGFAQLGPEGQTAVLRNAEALGNHRGAQRNLRELATSEGFAALNPDQQQAMLNIQAGDPTDRGLTQELVDLSADPAFRGLEDSVKTTTLVQLGQHSTDDRQRGILTQLATSPSFAGLPADDQNRLMNYVGGTNGLSDTARQHLGDLMDSDGFQNAALDQQQAMLRGVTQNQGLLPHNAADIGGLGTLPRQPFTVHGPTSVPQHPFRSGVADANLYEVEIAGRRIPVYVTARPNPANGHFHTIDQVAQGLAALPASGLALVDQVSVDPAANPTNTAAYMTADVNGDVTLYPMPFSPSQDTLDYNLIHETGHPRSMQAWGTDNSSARWEEWRTAAESDGIQVSQYSTKDPGEDFSETLVLYERVRGTPEEAEFRAMMPERFRILDAMLGGTP